MSGKLRDLIRAVRACKTAAQERETIAKECATLVRTAMRARTRAGMCTRRTRSGLPALLA